MSKVTRVSAGIVDGVDYALHTREDGKQAIVADGVAYPLPPPDSALGQSMAFHAKINKVEHENKLLRVVNDDLRAKLDETMVRLAQLESVEARREDLAAVENKIVALNATIKDISDRKDADDSEYQRLAAVLESKRVDVSTITLEVQDLRRAAKDLKVEIKQQKLALEDICRNSKASESFRNTLGRELDGVKAE